MRIAVDTNVIVSALLKRSKTQELLFESAFSFYAPDFSQDEIEKHEAEFMEKSGYSGEEFYAVLNAIFSNIKIVPMENYRNWQKDALELTPDKDDWPFFALAMQMDVPLWSFDKKLKEQKKVRVISIEELIEIKERFKRNAALRRA